MPTSRITISIPMLLQSLEGARVAGFDINRLLKKCDIDPILLEQTEVRIPLEKFVLLSRYTAGNMNDELVGLLNKPVRLGFFHALALNAVHADSIEQAFERAIAFNNLLKKLVVVRQSVNYQRSYINENQCFKTSSKEHTVKSLIREELSATDYLRQLKPAMRDYYKNHYEKTSYQNPKENIIRRIDLLAEKYYRNLLDSCSIEEKHVLYDTADDLIVNPKNKASIFSLLEKGLLIKECDKINFFNMSFRRFVMNSLNRAWATEIEVKMRKETRTWKGYKITLTIIIIALFVFIAMANQNFFDNLNQLFIIIAGGITAITGILGLLSRQNKPTGE